MKTRLSILFVMLLIIGLVNPNDVFSIEEADLEGEDLEEADLEGEDLEEADLEGEDLEEADLEGEDLEEADLEGEDLEEADLEGEDLEENLIPVDYHSGELKWQMIFLSSYPACSNYQYQMLNRFDSIAEGYMKMYEFENVKYKQACMSLSKYSKDNVPSDINLIILVYDRDIGREELHNKGIGGFYHHEGIDMAKNHAIVFCDCPNFKFSDPVWILTQELSHFILFYNGFNEEIVQGLVDSNDIKFDSCIDMKNNNSCKNIETKLADSYTTYEFNVMAPYQPAIGKKSTPNKIINVIDNPQTLEVQKEITNWWQAGKINDTEYARALSHFIDIKKATEIKEDTLPFDYTITLFETAKDKNLSDLNNKVNLTKNQLKDLFVDLPFDSDTTDGITLYLKDKKDLPEWFKTKAKQWTTNQLRNNEFMNEIEKLFTFS